jgi:ubiquinone/menaquinone biosynthesis C-methylase UbiE
MTEHYPDRMPNLAFKIMAAIMAVQDRLFPRIDKRIEGFPLEQGMTVVDYGCGPGRYTTRFARLVGNKGMVYAIDLQDLALEYVIRQMQKQGLNNIPPVLAKGYRTNLPDHSADRIFMLDMIFSVKEPSELLAEVHRICRPDGKLIVDDGHQPRERTIQMIRQSGLWKLEKESRDHLECVSVAGPDFLPAAAR